MIFNVSGGGASMNLSVASYTTEENLLAAKPAENTIGVVPKTDVTSWIFSPIEPSEPTLGLVWFTIGKFSPGTFNLLKKNSIEICPMYAMQYVDGTWVDIPAMNYLKGTWVQWTTDITIYNNGATDHQLTLKQAKDSGTDLTLTLGTNGNATVMSDVITLSGQTQLAVQYSNLTGTNTFAGGIRARVWDTDDNIVASTNRKTAVSGVLTLDISSLSGQYKVGVFANNSSGSYAGSCRVSSIKIVT